MEQDTRKVIMVRFGEIFLKSEPVRREFLNSLERNIRNAFSSTGAEVSVVITRSRLIVTTTGHDDPVSLLSRIFGIVDVSPVLVTGTSVDELCDTAVDLAKKHLSPSKRFAVRARRERVEGFSSQELAAEAGSRIIDSIPDLIVDLTTPEYEIFIEARYDGGMVYDTRIPGPGGLPYGTQGRAVALISAGIDSPVAAWLMMKRGVKMLFLHVDPGKFGGPDIRQNLMNNLKALSHWVPGRNLTLVSLPAEDLFQRIMSLSEPRFRCVICKRTMLEIGDAFAEKTGSAGIVTGDNLGQVATQTLVNLAPISAGIHTPIYRPLIGYDKEEIIALARKIGSFSAEPGDTSCNVLPPRPATKSEEDQIQKLMDEVKIREMIPALLEEGMRIKIKNGDFIE